MRLGYRNKVSFSVLFFSYITLLIYDGALLDSNKLSIVIIDIFILFSITAYLLVIKFKKTSLFDWAMYALYSWMIMILIVTSNIFGIRDHINMDAMIALFNLINIIVFMSLHIYKNKSIEGQEW